MASASAGAERQWRVMGALSALEGATAVVSPILIAALFAAAVGATTWHFPGAPFVLAAMMYLIAAGSVWTVRAARPAWPGPPVSPRRGSTGN
jgi:hypothetical protein